MSDIGNIIWKFDEEIWRNGKVIGNIIVCEEPLDEQSNSYASPHQIKIKKGKQF